MKELQEKTVFEVVSVKDECPNIPENDMTSEQVFVICGDLLDIATYHESYVKGRKNYWRNFDNDGIKPESWLRERTAIVLSKDQLVELLKEAHEKGWSEFYTDEISCDKSFDYFLKSKGLDNL